MSLRSTVPVSWMPTFRVGILVSALLPASALIPLLPCPSTAQSGPGMTGIAVPGMSGREDAGVTLTLQDAVRIALDESFDIQRLKERYLQLSYGLETARRSLRTRVMLNSILPHVQEGYTSYFFTDFAGTMGFFGFEESLRRAQTSLSVVQPLITNGYVSLTSRLRGYERTMHRLPAGATADIRYLMPQLALEYTQPLFQYNAVKGQLREATLDLEALTLSYPEVELQRINEISDAFFRLFAAQRLLDIETDAATQSVRAAGAIRQRCDLGLASEFEAVEIEVAARNARDRLMRAQETLLRTQLAFKRAVGIDPDEPIRVAASDEIRPCPVDPQRARELAFSNRSDIRRAEIEVAKADLEIGKVASWSRPDLEVYFGYDVSGNSTIGGLGYADSWADHFDAAFQGDNMLRNTNVGITLSLPLYDARTNESRVQRLMSERRVLEREVTETEAELARQVILRVDNVASAQARAELQAGNREAARAGYEISLELFEKGEISGNEMLIAQSRYLETERNWTDAFIDFEMAKAWLREITLFDWETGQPVRQQTTPSEPFGRRQDIR